MGILMLCHGSIHRLIVAISSNKTDTVLLEKYSIAAVNHSVEVRAVKLTQEPATPIISQCNDIFNYRPVYF